MFIADDGTSGAWQRGEFWSNAEIADATGDSGAAQLEEGPDDAGAARVLRGGRRLAEEQVSEGDRGDEKDGDAAAEGAEGKGEDNASPVEGASEDDDGGAGAWWGQHRVDDIGGEDPESALDSSEFEDDPWGDLDAYVSWRTIAAPFALMQSSHPSFPRLVYPFPYTYLPFT